MPAARPRGPAPALRGRNVFYLLPPQLQGRPSPPSLQGRPRYQGRWRDQAITQARRTSLGCGQSCSSICSAKSSDLHTLQNGYCQVEGKATCVGHSLSRLFSTHMARPHPCGLLPLLRSTLSGALFWPHCWRTVETQMWLDGSGCFCLDVFIQIYCWLRPSVHY